MNHLTDKELDALTRRIARGLRHVAFVCALAATAMVALLAAVQVEVAIDRATSEPFEMPHGR